ncbi:MAG TPA: AMP-binding protein, partial [Gemmatimonadales bacterium]|nr:AMP-binding protein [Gemmatimonadales bacterium]
MRDLPLVARATTHGGRLAIAAPEGRFTYRDLLGASERAASVLLAGRRDLAEARIAFLVPPGWHYVVVQWAVWRAGGVAVPLATSHPPAELDYAVRDAGAETVVGHRALLEKLRAVPAVAGRRLVTTE